MTRATGIGSWPGTDVVEALRAVRDELTEVPEGVEAVPYLPELPARGPVADMVGRATGLLVDLPVDLSPQGWRLVARPGRDARRTASVWRQDLQELAEAFDGWTGQLKIQVSGPWTLAAALWLPRGERVLSDAGATRELTGSLAEGVAAHVAAVRGLLPDAQVVVQLDEPGLPAVLQGSVRSASGFRALSPVEGQAARAGLGEVLRGASAGGAAQTAVHCCGDNPPMELLRGTGSDALAVDTTTFGPDGWESVAAAVEQGLTVWAGALAGHGDPPPYQQVVEHLTARWREVGLPPARLADLTVTPSCGLASATPDQARSITRTTVTVAAELAERADR